MRPPVPQAQPGSAKPARPADAHSGTEEGTCHGNDLELVRRVLRGDSGAEEPFVQRMSCARRFLVYKNASFGAPLGTHELEDVVQSTLLAVWRKLGEYAGTGSLEAWVYRFAYLELVNRLQAIDRRPRELELADEELEPATEGLARLDPLERERLYRGLERLDDAAGEIIRLKHLEARTFEQISVRLGIPVNTAKTRYYRGMERLRQLLRDPRAAGETRA